ncbi:MAG: polysaccharide deacetylase family protein [Candidatus Hodarchaeales archaeon]|jgi:predicted glycoside hydrolase/deacetylase ChbG (UPF0249 family)
MTDETFLQKLGFSQEDKVVILHVDDMGFSHAANVASFECLDFGIASCGSVIVPAPWFLEVASVAKKNPKYDIGVHLTLTCEYTSYRWRALSSVENESGLLAEDGCLWKTTEEAIANITPEAAEAEMRMQIDRALQSGIDVTHIDTHMGVVMDPKFIQSYLALSTEYRVPAFLPKISKEQLFLMGLGEYADIYQDLLVSLESSGFPLIDHMIIETGGVYPNKNQYYHELLKGLKPGLSHLLFHPAKMSPELDAITPNSAEWRNQDYKAFIDHSLHDYVDKLEITIIGYREIRELIRKQE